jgi:exonuclease SbcC
VATLIEQLKTNERTASEAEVESEKLASGLLAEELVATDDVKELKAKQASFSETITTIGNFESDGQERRRELDRLLPAAESALEELEQGGPDTELAKAEAAAKSAEQSRREAREALLEIRRLRTAGMAAELAEGLEDGSPCPVCGSTEHPGMDHSTAPSVSKEDEEAADRKDGQAEQRAADAAARRDAVKTAEAERKAEIRKEVLHLTAERDRLVAKESELAAGEATPTARREKLESVVEQIGAYLESTGLAAERRSSADASRKTALAQAEACGFDGLEAAEAAAIDAGELERGKAQVAEYDEALNKAKGLLGGELSKVDPDEVVDLRPLEAAAEAAITRRDHDTGVLATARERLGTFSESTDPIQGLFEELEPLRTAAARSNELSRLASGDNEMRIRLSTYVLAVRLKQVIQAANVHLQKMSNGRYELVYSGDVAAHGAASGLDIGIYDSHTSASRSTGTLSGGESFYASLSLALGLAEVVQQETGGKRLETLFIDEGFGTLDSKTLDQVMDVIDDLREGGRTVGLVSHVDELRNRVTARIEVSATRDGSTIDVVGV